MTFSIPSDPAVRRSLMLLTGSIGLACLLVRIVGIVLWSVRAENSLADSLLVESAATLFSVVIICSIVALMVLFGYSFREDIRSNAVTGSIGAYSVGCLILLVLASVLPDDSVRLRSVSISGTIATHTVAVGAFCLATGLSTFLVHFFMAKRHARTKLYLIVIGVLVVCAWVASAFAKGHPTFSVIATLFTAVACIVMLMTTKRLQWLASVTLEKKVRFLWLASCAFLASAVLAGIHLWGDSSMLAVSSASFVRGGSKVLGVVHLLGFVFFARLLFAVIAAIPNSSVVDRRSSEVESMAHIMRMLTTSGSTVEMLQSTTHHALLICGAHGAWTELYEAGELRVVASELVRPDYVRMLHVNPTVSRCIRETTVPTLVGSLLTLSKEVEPLALRSMIVVPIMSDQRRTGSLVVFSTVEYGFEDEDVRLLRAFGDMVSIALDQARLVEATLQQERLQREAELARDIQASLLPRNTADVKPFEVHAIMSPATEVGGDYFDYVRFADGSSGVIIADVAGKGIPAALYMATLKGTVRAEMRVSTGPADLLCRVNTTLIGSMEKRSYISLSCVQFHTNRSSVTLARAGHTPAVFRVNGSPLIVRPRGVAVGIVPPEIFNPSLEEVEIAMHPGDICLLTTDGVTERRDGAYNEIGVEALAERVVLTKAQTASGVISEILAALDQHAQQTDPHDDITIVSITVPHSENTTEVM